MVVTRENIATHLYEVYKKLKEKYNYNIIEEIPQIIKVIDTECHEELVQSQADELQRINNILYSRYGDSDEVILFQARINQLRNLYDVPDKSELKYDCSDGEFAQ